jgi:6-phosphogluconate dehydrogenase (decarboxylating)
MDLDFAGPGSSPDGICQAEALAALRDEFGGHAVKTE